MINKGNPYQKKGNNALFLVLGVLIVVFLGLIYVGSVQESSISQLINAAAPDSSAYANDSLLSQPSVAEEVPEEIVETKKPERVVVRDTAQVNKTLATTEKQDSTPSKSATPVVVPAKVVESAEGTIYPYKVKRGDTMYKIAAKFGNKPDDVLTLNGMSDMNLQADKDIKVKIKGLHNVADGEGLNAIAAKYSVAAKSIKIANDLTSDVLPDGAQLIIPLK